MLITRQLFFQKHRVQFRYTHEHISTIFLALLCCLTHSFAFLGSGASLVCIATASHISLKLLAKYMQRMSLPTAFVPLHRFLDGRSPVVAAATYGKRPSQYASHPHHSHSQEVGWFFPQFSGTSSPCFPDKSLIFPFGCGFSIILLNPLSALN